MLELKFAGIESMVSSDHASFVDQGWTLPPKMSLDMLVVFKNLKVGLEGVG